MYYAFIENDKINGIGQCRCLNDYIQNIEISEEIYNNIDKYIWNGTEIVLNPNYEEEQADKRQEEFLKDFFYIDNYGYYRKQPKGYQSAVESMNVLFNIANVSNGIQAGLIIFYQEPDFTKPEECTEEWLVAHQLIQPAMTKEAFMDLYVAFMTAWNTQEHTTEGEDETPTDNDL